MLMRPHDGTVDHRVFVIGVCRQGIENTLPNALMAPPHVARMKGPEITEPLRQIAPRDARAVAIKNRLDKQTIVFRGHPNIRGLARQKLFYPLPWGITKGVAAHLYQLQGSS